MSSTRNFVGLKGAAMMGATILALAGCSSDEPVVADNATGPAGNGVCLPVAQIDHTQILTDNAILFWMKDGKTWVNTLPISCPSLTMEGGFTYVSDPLDVCSNSQTLRVLRSGNFCELGQFEKFDPPKTPLDEVLPTPKK